MSTTSNYKSIPLNWYLPYLDSVKNWSKYLDISWYEYSRNVNPEYARSQFVTGKLAEFAVWNILKSKNIEISPPSLDTTGTGFKEDLIGPKYKVEVKSTPSKSSERYGLSWSFTTKNNRHLENPSENSYVALVETRENEMHFYGFIKYSEVKSRLKSPQGFHSSSYKMFLHHSDITDLVIYRLPSQE